MSTPPRIALALRTVLLQLTLSIASYGCAERSVDRYAPSEPTARLQNVETVRYVPNQYLVRFTGHLTRSARDQVARRALGDVKGKLLAVLHSINGAWVELDAESLRLLRARTDVVSVQPDEVVPILSAYDSSIAPSPRWTLDRVDQRDLPLQGSYQFNKRGLGVHVWIVDTGLDITDPDIAANVDQSTYMTINGLNPFAPCDPHGTDVAKAAVGRVGVARGATLHAARVDTDCSGSLSNGAIIFALEYIADNTLRPAVVNLSLGRRCSLFTCLFTVESAAEYAQSKGVTVVVSAGNDGGDACDQSPARLQSLITVGASTLSDARADYPGLWASNWGACVDLFAPVFPSGGTSAAAPVVAGAAALFLEMFPTASPATVQANLVANATVGRLGPNLAGSPNRLLYTMQRTLTAAISGASHIGPFTSCAWYGSHDGGYPPYVYKWYRDQVLVGQSTSYSIEAGESAGFALELRVEDGRGNIASSARAVAFDSNNGGFVCQ